MYETFKADISIILQKNQVPTLSWCCVQLSFHVVIVDIITVQMQAKIGITILSGMDNKWGFCCLSCSQNEIHVFKPKSNIYIALHLIVHQIRVYIQAFNIQKRHNKHVHMCITFPIHIRTFKQISLDNQNQQEPGQMISNITVDLKKIK